MTNVAREAIDVLKTRGWTQSAQTIDDDGKVCALGALGIALGYDADLAALDRFAFDECWVDPTANKLAEIIKAEYPDTWGANVSSVVYSFNDNDHTSFSELERMFEKTAVWIDEQV